MNQLLSCMEPKQKRASKKAEISKRGVPLFACHPRYALDNSTQVQNAVSHAMLQM